MNNKITIGLTVASIAFANVFASAQSGTGSVQVTVDGNPVTFEAAQPQTIKGRVLVPLRGIFEQIGANVDWDPTTQSVKIDGNGRHIRLQIGSFDANVNGRVVAMDVAPQVIDDSTMVPLRFLSQAMGERVDWEPDKELVAITTIPQRAERFAPVQQPTPPPPVILSPPSPPPIIVNPPPVVIQPPPPPPEPLRPEMYTIQRDVVIPLTLDMEITSNQNHAGDHFVAEVHGDAGRYMDFPDGTQVEGYVRSVTPAYGSHGGTLDLRFTHIRFPDGNRYRISGCVVPLDNRNVIRTAEGRYVVRGGRDSAIARDAEVGAGAGLLVGAYVGKAVGGAALGGSIGAIIGAFDHSLGRNVIFHEGTRLGLILGDELKVGRDDLVHE